MAWTSTDDIVKELKLNSSSDDFNGLKSELRLKLAELHPDKKGGSFTSSDDEEKYNKVAAAYDFVNLSSQGSKALIPITQLPAIIKAVRDAQLAPTQSQVSQLRTECREESRFDARNRHTLPRIGSGVFAAICTFLFTFSSSLSEHPLLGFIAKNMVIQMTMVVLAAYAGIFFLLTWVRERKEEGLTDFIMSENGRREIFNNVLMVAGHKKFSVRNVMKTIQELFGSRRSDSPFHIFTSVFFAQPTVKSSIAEKIAQMHLLELEKRGAVHRVEVPSIDALFEFDEELDRNFY